MAKASSLYKHIDEFNQVHKTLAIVNKALDDEENAL